MKSFAGLLCVFLFANTAAAGSEFSGHWKGTGTYQSEDLIKAIEADFDILITQTDAELKIKECWTVPDAILGRRTSCYQSDYTLNAAEQIFARGKKVGDIFPGKVFVYQGNSQVSESMSFALNGKRELLFRYSYSNFDGGLNIQFAQLPEIQSQP